MLDSDQLDQWFTVLGYGNLEAPVWFVGIEPGTDEDGKQASEGPHPDLLKEKIGDDEVRWDPLPCEKAPEGKFSLAWKRPIKILQGVWEGHPGGEADHWQWAWQHMMAANLAPLPRKSINTKLIGIDENIYHQRVIDKRVPMLHRIFMNQPSLRVMVFHGKGAWTRYGVESGFGVTGDGWQKIQPSIAPHIQAWEYGKRRLVLTRSMTWNRYFDNAACDALAAKLKEWRNDDKDWPQGQLVFSWQPADTIRVRAISPSGLINIPHREKFYDPCPLLAVRRFRRNGISSGRHKQLCVFHLFGRRTRERSHEPRKATRHTRCRPCPFGWQQKMLPLR